MRHLASSGVDPYTALSGAAGTLFGERKSTAVIKMLKGIESVQSIPSFLQSVKDSAKQSKDAPPERARRPIRLMGFGHRIYQVMDPRAKIAKNLLIKIIDLMGMDSLTGKAFALEEQVLNDEWFNSRKLFPNVDYWLAIIFSLLDFPVDMFPVWMFIPRVSGLIAHLIESIDDPDYKIFRPRQVYLGQDFRKYESGTNVRQSMTAPTFDGKTTDSKAVEMRTNRIPRRSTSLSDKHQEKMDLLYEMSLLKVSLDHMATAMNISEEMPPAVSLSGSPSTSMRFGSKNLRSKSGGSAAELDTTDVSAANLGCYSVVDGRNTENETIARSAFCKIG